MEILLLFIELLIKLALFKEVELIYAEPCKFRRQCVSYMKMLFPSQFISFNQVRS